MRPLRICSRILTVPPVSLPHDKRKWSETRTGQCFPVQQHTAEKQSVFSLQKRPASSHRNQQYTPFPSAPRKDPGTAFWPCTHSRKEWSSYRMLSAFDTAPVPCRHSKHCRRTAVCSWLYFQCISTHRSRHISFCFQIDIWILHRITARRSTAPYPVLRSSLLPPYGIFGQRVPNTSPKVSVLRAPCCLLTKIKIS